MEGVVLKLHMGVGAGELSEFYVGGHGGKWEYFVAGQPIEQMSEATEEAAHGQLVLSKQAHEALQGDAEARAKLNLHGRQLPSEQYLLDELLETSRSRKRRWSNSHRRVRAVPPALVLFAPAPLAYSDLFQPPLYSLIHHQYHPSPLVSSALSSSPPNSRPPPSEPSIFSPSAFPSITPFSHPPHATPSFPLSPSDLSCFRFLLPRSPPSPASPCCRLLLRPRPISLTLFTISPHLQSRQLSSRRPLPTPPQPPTL